MARPRKEEKKRGRPKNKVGRPSKISQEKIDIIVNALRTGAYIETCALHAGVDKRTIYDWLKKGNNGENELCVKFLNAVNKAMAEAELRDIRNIQMHAEKDWRASAWRLERKFPKKWGYKQQIQELGENEEIGHKSIIDQITEDE